MTRANPGMGLCLEKIEQTVNAMDMRYDANFGDWIRNEDNCKIVGVNMRKYVDKYKTSDFIIVVKWIVKDWTLKSIILFSKRLIIDGLLKNTKEEYDRRIKIITGFVYTWNAIFVAEFLLSSTKDFDPSFRATFFVDILQSFETSKLRDILTHMERKIDDKTRVEVSRLFSKGVYNSKTKKCSHTDSLINAFTLL